MANQIEIIIDGEKYELLSKEIIEEKFKKAVQEDLDEFDSYEEKIALQYSQNVLHRVLYQLM